MVLLAEAMMEAQGPRPRFADFGKVPESNPWTTSGDSGAAAAATGAAAVAGLGVAAGAAVPAPEQASGMGFSLFGSAPTATPWADTAPSQAPNYSLFSESSVGVASGGASISSNYPSGLPAGGALGAGGYTADLPAVGPWILRDTQHPSSPLAPETAEDSAPIASPMYASNDADATPPERGLQQSLPRDAAAMPIVSRERPAAEQAGAVEHIVGSTYDRNAIQRRSRERMEVGCTASETEPAPKLFN